MGRQGGEAARGQGAEERVQFLSGRGVAEALLGRRRGVAEGKADGAVVDEAERPGGLTAGQSGREQRREECLGNGERCGANGVAGLEQGGDAGMVPQDRPQPVRAGGDLAASSGEAGPSRRAWRCADTTVRSGK